MRGLEATEAEREWNGVGPWAGQWETLLDVRPWVWRPLASSFGGW